ncbi:hypothetical protein Bcop_1505 [Bacteroides coprosuis DSM 18011]|uniref:Uncharacterized protein n=1 Tax=Bacteroides coprosuis DSM 18011 TaxID=679937 RepID=F3ZPW2_9BACE|nr:hypothetical protein [Bacteroides coprosuis]EGJ71699.1 hypothetical protein Bcop_1505 [Bacteroides coprosuis DSM 18011]HJD92124.1 hypothetical protein [Bacteroides coprosuis]
MTLNQTDLYNFDEVLANTRIDKFGRLREYYKLQDGKVVDFSLELFYEPPTQPNDLRIIYYEDEYGNDKYEVYCQNTRDGWHPIPKNLNSISADKLKEYKRIFKEKYHKIPSDIYHFINLMQKSGEEFNSSRQLNFFSIKDVICKQISNITIRWSFERFRQKMGEEREEVLLNGFT